MTERDAISDELRQEQANGRKLNGVLGTNGLQLGGTGAVGLIAFLMWQDVGDIQKAQADAALRFERIEVRMELLEKSASPAIQAFTNWVELFRATNPDLKVPVFKTAQ